MRFCFFILFCVCSLFAFSQVRAPESKRTPSSADTSHGTSRALVIGVSSYQQIDSLQFADDDAIEFAHYLLSSKQLNMSKENMTLLTNEKARSGNILAALSALFEMSRPGDMIYFYFSGHGDVEVTDSNNKGYLLVHDTPRNNYATGGISVDILQKVFTSITEKGVKLFVVTDACRAGHLAGGAAGVQHTARSFSTQWRNEVKILSAQPDEVSFESKNWGGGRGVFSFYLVKGLSGFADFNKDSIVTLSELEQYVGLQVSEATKYKQQPIFQGPQKFSNAVAVTDKQQMEKWAKWDSDHPMTVAVIKGGKETGDPECESYQGLLNILNKPTIDSNDLLSAFSLYKAIKDCGLSIQTKARYELSAALMNDVQQIVNQTLIGQKFVYSSQVILAQRKIDSLFALNVDSRLLYENHFKNLKAYLLAERISREDKNWLSMEYVRNVLMPTLDKALKEEGNPSYIYYAKGNLFGYRFYQFDSSIFYFKKAAEQSPTWLMPKLMIGLTYKAINQLDSAERWLAAVEQMDTVFRTFECVECFYEAIADVYYDLKRYDLSEKYYHAVLQMNAVNGNALMGLFYTNYWHGNKKKAFQWLEKLDAVETDLRDQMETCEYLIEGRYLSKKDILRRLEHISNQLEEKSIKAGEVDIEPLRVYMIFLRFLYDYYYHGKYKFNTLDYLDERWAMSSGELEYRLKILRFKFKISPSPQIMEYIEYFQESRGHDLNYDEYYELEFMKAFCLLNGGRLKPNWDQHEANNKALIILKDLLDRGYIRCEDLQEIKEILSKIPEAKKLNCNYN